MGLRVVTQLAKGESPEVLGKCIRLEQEGLRMAFQKLFLCVFQFFQNFQNFHHPEMNIFRQAVNILKLFFSNATDIWAH